MSDADHPESNEELIRYVTIRTINQGDFEVAAEFYADDVDYYRQGDLRGYDDLIRDSEMWHDAFPDIEASIVEVITDGQWSTFRYTIRGTQEAAFEGIPPTGRTVEAQGIGAAKIVDGEIVEYHLVFDGLGLIQQLGVMEEWEGKQ